MPSWFDKLTMRNDGLAAGPSFLTLSVSNRSVRAGEEPCVMPSRFGKLTMRNDGLVAGPSFLTLSLSKGEGCT
jgi:hypothetical protein